MGSQGACQMIEAFATMSCRLDKALRVEWAKSASLETREKQLKEYQEALSKSEKKASDFEHKFNESQAERVSLTYELAKERELLKEYEEAEKLWEEDLKEWKEKASHLEHEVQDLLRERVLLATGRKQLKECQEALSKYKEKATLQPHGRVVAEPNSGQDLWDY